MSIRYFEFQHFLREFLVGYFGVVLCGGDALVTENFGKAFYGHVVAEGYRGSEGVTGDVEGELFGDAGFAKKNAGFLCAFLRFSSLWLKVKKARKRSVRGPFRNFSCFCCRNSAEREGFEPQVPFSTTVFLG